MPLINREIKDVPDNHWLRFQVGHIRERAANQPIWEGSTIVAWSKCGTEHVFHLLGFGSTLDEAEAMAMSGNGHHK
jgi:hypothetical protein